MAEAQEAMETAAVRRDTLRVTVDAAGSLTPQAEVSLTFSSSGLVTEVFVEEGLPIPKRKWVVLNTLVYNDLGTMFGGIVVGCG
jgi:hypothetical protein